MDCLKLHMRYENEGEENEIAEWEKKNKQLDCLKLHMRYEKKWEANEIAEWKKMNKSMHCLNFISHMKLKKRKRNSWIEEKE